MRIVRLIVAGCVLAVAAGTGSAVAQQAAQQSDSPLVQAAKQKSTTKKAKRVYTNEDYPETAEQPATAPADKPVTAATVAAKPGDAAKAGVPAEKDKAKPADAKGDQAKPAEDPKLADLESKLADAKKGESELQRKLNALQDKANNERDENRRNMYLDMISNQQTTLSEFRRTQENLQRQIEDEKDRAKKE